MCVLTGAAGVGKTALAVHWVHRVAEQFPDGQLYVNLRRFDLGGSVMDPAEAIRSFLDALNVAPDQFPSGLDAQAGPCPTQPRFGNIPVDIDDDGTAIGWFGGRPGQTCGAGPYRRSLARTDFTSRTGTLALMCAGVLSEPNRSVFRDAER
jgi:hypothetical protein